MAETENIDSNKYLSFLFDKWFGQWDVHNFKEIYKAFF